MTQLRSTTSLALICRSMNSSSLPKSTTVSPVSPPSLSTIIDDLTQHVSNLNDECTTLRAVLNKYSSLFDTSIPKIADTTSVHTIRTGDAHPQNSRAYPQNSEHRTATENIIENMLRAKQIRPSISPWSSPMLLARKKDNTYRFVVDYRKLNAVSTKDAYPIPTIEETLQRIRGHHFFTKLDLASGYFQIPIREEDKAKTAFTTGRALYEFNVLPQGLKNASASFQRIMNTLLVTKREAFCIVYMDDILTFSDTFAEHLQHVDEVMKVLHDHRFTVSPPKCSIAQSSIDYLGHTISINRRHSPQRQHRSDREHARTSHAQRRQSLHRCFGFLSTFHQKLCEARRHRSMLCPTRAKIVVVTSNGVSHNDWHFKHLKTAITTKPLLSSFPRSHSAARSFNRRLEQPHRRCTESKRRSMTPSMSSVISRVCYPIRNNDIRRSRRRRWRFTLRWKNSVHTSSITRSSSKPITALSATFTVDLPAIDASIFGQSIWLIPTSRRSSTRKVPATATLIC